LKRFVILHHESYRFYKSAVKDNKKKSKVVPSHRVCGKAGDEKVLEDPLKLPFAPHLVHVHLQMHPAGPRAQYRRHDNVIFELHCQDPRLE
jgi:hypothetical protein